jgi:hypothetical protein
MPGRLPLLLVALPTLSCRKSVGVYFRECTSPRSDTAICLIVETELSSADSVNAWSLYQTREVDPQKLGPETWATPSGVLSIKLNNGQTVTHSGTLYLDYNTQPPAVQQGAHTRTVALQLVCCQVSANIHMCAPLRSLLLVASRHRRAAP